MQPFVGEFRELNKVLVRSSGWRNVRSEHLIIQPYCQVCGKTKGLQVHHIFPFHLYPHLELELTNLVTFCGDHHLWIGHLGYWKTYNPDVIVDALIWYEKYSNRNQYIAN